MFLRRRTHLVACMAGALLLLPLACERSDHDVTRGGDGDGDGDGQTGGTTGLGGVDGGDGDETGSGGVFVTPGVGGTASGGAPVLPEPLLETCSPWEVGMGGGPGMPSVGDASGSLVIDDFEDGDNLIWGNGLSGRWESHRDETATKGLQSPLGGIHEPGAVWTDSVGGNDTFEAGYMSTNALHMTGSGWEQWGSGQSVYFAQDNDGIACLFDASAYAGITFWAKGTVELEYPSDDDKKPKNFETGLVRVHIVDRDVIPNEGNEPDAEAGGECDQSKYVCWDSPVQRIEVKDCWQKYVLAFDDFDADGWSKWKPESPGLDPEEAYQLVFQVSEYQSYELWLDDVEFFTGDDVPSPVTCP